MKQAIHAEVQREVGEILVPPKYTLADFSKPSFWRLRGKLDVPKERGISYPGAERSVDPTLVISWTGWNHLQQAQAIAAHYERLKSDGAPDTQLMLVLASLHEMIPWLLQWAQRDRSAVWRTPRQLLQGSSTMRAVASGHGREFERAGADEMRGSREPR